MAIRSSTHARSQRPFPTAEALESRLLLSYTYSVIAPLRGRTSGNQPEGLIMDADGNLFGTTASGGAKGYGAVFEIAASSNTVTTLVSFNGKNGLAPRGGLVLDGDGHLLGTTIGGGANGKGTIFEVNLAGSASTITTLASFDGTNGAYPFSGLTVDSSGDLFGTTLGAPGIHFKPTVFELATGSSTITVLATFKSTDRLTNPLLIDSSGNIFGTTNGGGSAARGSVFKISGSAHTLTTLASFKGGSGSNPLGNLVMDGSGNLIGTTSGGGASGAGTLFSLNPNASVPTIATLVSFNVTNGNHPLGNLILDADGNLFGVTAAGGANGTGTVFEFPTGTASTLSVLYSFRGQATGTNPSGPLIMDAEGSFWGVAFAGGPSNSGVAFELHNDSVVFAPPPAPQSALPDIGAAGVATHLTIVRQPTSARSGSAFTVQIALTDDQNRVVDSASTLTLVLVAGPSGGKIAGTLTAKFVNGVAALSNVTLTGKGDYTLKALTGTFEILTSPIAVV